MPTHAHYAGEFGARQQTSTLAKDPAYRGARAEHFAREALKSGEAHRVAESHVDRAAHALVVAHASQMASKHARAAEKIAPGSEHARYAREAADTAARQHENVLARESEPHAKQTQKIDNQSMRETLASQPRAKSASLAPDEKMKTSKVHERMAELNKEAAALSPAHVQTARDASKQMTQPIPIVRAVSISADDKSNSAQVASRHAAGFSSPDKTEKPAIAHSESISDKAARLTVEANRTTVHSTAAQSAAAHRAAARAHANAAQLLPISSKLHELHAAAEKIHKDIIAIRGTKGKRSAAMDIAAQITSHNTSSIKAALISPKTEKPAIAPSPISDEHLARLAKDAANRAPVEHGFGDRKVFIHRVFQGMQTDVPGMSLQEFKDRVRGMQRKMLIETSRADLVGAMNNHDVAKSHTSLTSSDHNPNGSRGPHVNTISREPGHEKSWDEIGEHHRMIESMGHQHWKETEFK